MNVFRQMYRGEQHFDFPKLWRIFLAASALFFVVSVGSLVTRGLNLGIEFEGGTSWEVVAPDAGVADARAALKGTDAAAGKIQTVGGDSIRVRASTSEQAKIDAVTAAMAELGGVDTTSVSVTTVGPSWGDQITHQARNALIWFFVIVAAYISIRLEWKMAVGAVVAVIHDIIISVGLYSIFQFEVTPATVIAFLTIMGYSLYDTIVVYDQVHEISRRLGPSGRYTYTEMMNAALNQVLMRSINTSLTSVLPVLSMLLIGSVFLGALTLQEFAIALLIGILVGGYSSISVASAAVAFLKEREPAYASIRQRLGDEVRGPTRVISTEDAAASVVVRRAGVDRTRVGSAPPRPRKKKR
ncbi:MAG: protein translocase subunit SecF [Acidimicrobiales bacterium]